MMPVVRYTPKLWLPDQGEIDNPGWLEVKNVLPYAGGWLIDSRLSKRVVFFSSLSDTDIRGMHVHPANGTLGWTIYVGTDTKIFAVEPSGWSKSTVATGQASDLNTGWQFCAYGSNEIAVGGHLQEALVRVNDTGNFVGLVTNSQPDNLRFAKCWQEDNSGAPDYVDITINCNDSGASDAQPFPNTAAANDAVYFGRLVGLPADLSINVGTAGVGTYTVTWEYWNGSWTALSGVTDNTTGFTVAGVSTVIYTDPTDAVAVAVNGSQDLYWIRGRISAFTSMTTNPKLSQIGEYTAWPPQPKFVANWGGAVAIASYANVGPATEYGDPDPNGIWISDRTGRIFGSSVSHPSKRTTYLSLTDEHGDISGLVGGDEFGVVLKPKAIYRVNYGGNFRVDIRVASSSLGSIFPNGWVWANRHELFGMTSAGPVVMTQSGLDVIGIDQWQRTIFDTSWLVDTFAMNTDQSARYLLYATYSRVTDIVSWFYRSTQDTMDVQLNYHRGSGRASVCQRNNMRVSSANHGSRVIGAAAVPLAESTDFTGLKDVFIMADDEDGNIGLFEPASTGSYKWVARPEFTSPFLELAQLKKSRVTWLRPLYSLNAGGPAAPEITAKVLTKNRTGEPAGNTNIFTTTTENAEGLFKFSTTPEMFWAQINFIYGNTNGDNVENLAEIIERVDIGYQVGAELDA